jgi:putative iron-regulated protein
VASAGGHSKGFLGIEYLLFSNKGAAAALALLQGDGAPSRRRTLARSMGDEVASSAHQLDDAWAPAKGGYANEITGAGAASTRYPSQRAALDDIVGGVGFAFEEVVGVRLALPLGRKAGGTPDPSLDPTGASDSAAADLKASLDGIDALYGGAGLSSRVRMQSTVLDDRIAGQISDCATKVAAIPAPFETALTGATASVQASYDACKAAKGTWNTDVTSALGATLKPSDNDGD